MRRRILETAMKLFVDLGYENVSIRKIAEEIEYSPATTYLYFKDKDEIFYRLHEQGFELFLKRQKKAMSIQDPMERLARLARIYLKFAVDEPEYYDLMFIMKAPIRKVEDEWSCGYQSYGVLRQTMEECMIQNKIKAPHVDVATVAMWSYVHGLASLIIRNRLRMIPKEKIPALVTDVLNFLRENYFEKK